MAGDGAGQQSPKFTSIGWLTPQQAASFTPYIDALRAGLAELGYVEGRNIAIVFRYGDDAIERVPELAAELVQVPVDILLVQGAAVPIVRKLNLKVSFTPLAAIPFRRVSPTAWLGRAAT